jgi:hypothetical protein
MSRGSLAWPRRLPRKQLSSRTREFKSHPRRILRFSIPRSGASRTRDQGRRDLNENGQPAQRVKRASRNVRAWFGSHPRRTLRSSVRQQSLLHDGRLACRGMGSRWTAAGDEVAVHGARIVGSRVLNPNSAVGVGAGPLAGEGFRFEGAPSAVFVDPLAGRSAGAARGRFDLDHVLVAHDSTTHPVTFGLWMAARRRAVAVRWRGGGGAVRRCGCGVGPGG